MTIEESRLTGAVHLGGFADEESVTSNLLAVAHKFSRPRLAVSPAGETMAPAFDFSIASPEITKALLSECFCLWVGDRGVEPLTSTTSKWRSTN